MSIRSQPGPKLSIYIEAKDGKGDEDPLSSTHTATMTTPEQFTLEVWVKYAICVFCMLTRFAVRLYIPGWRNLDGTDVWCALAVVCNNIPISTPPVSDY